MAKMNNLSSIHTFLISDQEQFIDDAVRIAKLTLPQLDPRGDDLDFIPDTHEGALGVMSLASFLLKSIMPTGANWGKPDLSEETWDQLKEIFKEQFPAIKAVIEEVLKVRTKGMMKRLVKRMARSRSLRALQRIIVEGQVGYHMPPTGKIQIWPMRSIGVERAQGELTLMSIKMQADIDPLTDTLPKEELSGSETAEVIHKYILVDFRNDQVWTQDTDKGNPKLSKDMKDATGKIIPRLRPFMFWVGLGEVPDFENWSRGYAFNFFKLIDQIDHAGGSLSEAMSTAAWNLMLIDENSSLVDQKDKIEKARSNSVFIGSKDAISWVNSGLKLNDWGFVAQMKLMWANDMASVFAMGLKDRLASGNQPGSATETLQLVDEVRTQTGALLSAIDETVMQPMLRAELRYMEQSDPLLTIILEAIKVINPDFETDLEDTLEVQVITGAISAELQNGLEKLITGIFPALKALDPFFQIDSNEIATAYLDTISFPTEKFILPRLQPQPQLGAQGGAGAVEASGGQRRLDGPPVDTVQTAGGPQSASLQSAAQPGSPAQ